MRPILTALVLAALPLAGCLDVAPSDGADGAAVDQASTAEAPAARPTGTVEIGSMGFVLGPMGNSPVTRTSVSLSGLEVLEGARKVILRLELEQGATVDFGATGLDGCEQWISVPNSHVGGYERATECTLQPGLYTLTLGHLTGHVEGTVTVFAVYP